MDPVPPRPSRKTLPEPSLGLVQGGLLCLPRTRFAQRLRWCAGLLSQHGLRHDGWFGAHAAWSRLGRDAGRRTVSLCSQCDSLCTPAAATAEH